MQVKSVTVRNFRNLGAQKISLCGGLNVFTGLNAQGKTNFLESIVLCSIGKSPRTDRDKDMINRDGDWASVKTETAVRSGVCSVEIKLSRGEKKRVAVNGMPIARIGELMGRLNVIYFSPQEIRVIREGPDSRRRFMDIDLCQTDKNYFYTLARYNKILSQRNNLIKTQAKNADIKEMLSVWDAQLAEEGARLYLKRAGFAEKIFPLAADAHYALSGGKEELGVVYQTDMAGFSKEEAKADLIEKLSLDMEKQLRLGYTLRGPHRDDIKFTVDGVDIRKYGSQGQQRTAALSLKLAEVSLMEEITGERPVLILDDVFGEIDAARQNRLLEYISGTQTLVAATEFNKTPRGECRFFTVSGGKITQN